MPGENHIYTLSVSVSKRVCIDKREKGDRRWEEKQRRGERIVSCEGSEGGREIGSGRIGNRKLGPQGPSVALEVDVCVEGGGYCCSILWLYSNCVCF